MCVYPSSLPSSPSKHTPSILLPAFGNVNAAKPDFDFQRENRCGQYVWRSLSRFYIYADRADDGARERREGLVKIEENRFFLVYEN